MKMQAKNLIAVLLMSSVVIGTTTPTARGAFSLDATRLFQASASNIIESPDLSESIQRFAGAQPHVRDGIRKALEAKLTEVAKKDGSLAEAKALSDALTVKVAELKDPTLDAYIESFTKKIEKLRDAAEVSSKKGNAALTKVKDKLTAEQVVTLKASLDKNKEFEKIAKGLNDDLRQASAATTQPTSQPTTMPEESDATDTALLVGHLLSGNADLKSEDIRAALKLFADAAYDVKLKDSTRRDLRKALALGTEAGKALSEIETVKEKRDVAEEAREDADLRKKLLADAEDALATAGAEVMRLESLEVLLDAKKTALDSFERDYAQDDRRKTEKGRKEIANEILNDGDKLQAYVDNTPGPKLRKTAGSVEPIKEEVCLDADPASLEDQVGIMRSELDGIKNAISLLATKVGQVQNQSVGLMTAMLEGMAACTAVTTPEQVKAQIVALQKDVQDSQSLISAAQAKGQAAEQLCAAEQQSAQAGQQVQPSGACAAISMTEAELIAHQQALIKKQSALTACSNIAVSMQGQPGLTDAQQQLADAQRQVGAASEQGAKDLVKLGADIARSTPGVNPPVAMPEQYKLQGQGAPRAGGIGGVAEGQRKRSDFVPATTQPATDATGMRSKR